MEGPFPVAFGRLMHPRSIYDRLLRRLGGDASATPSHGSVRIYQDQYEHLMGLIKTNERLYRYVAERIKFRFVRREHRLYYSMPGRVHRIFANDVVRLIDTRIAEVAMLFDSDDKDGNVVENIANVIKQARVVDMDDVDVDGIWEFNWGPAENPDKACLALDIVYSHDYRAAERSMISLITRTEGRPALGVIISVSNNRMRDNVSAADSNMKKRAFYTIFKVTQKSFDDMGESTFVTKKRSKRCEFREESGTCRDGALRIPMRELIGPNHMQFVDRSDQVTMGILDEEISISNYELKRFLEKAEMTAESPQELHDHTSRSELSM
ncbi:hypothetical protein SLS58_009197 [Diplodia intermedia]|uniref:Uncharacterized protein n=1 Tax=Diplodia intermedia TaxID=856260 RepID=A0ABR3TDS8_9PEZI